MACIESPYKSITMKCVFLFAVTYFVVLTSKAQNPLQYQINEQSSGNCAGTQVTISVNTLASVITSSVSGILANVAVSGGNIVNDGGGTILQRGVCWSTMPAPTTSSSATNDGSGLGLFISNIAGLIPNTLYYLRAYAINSAGTFYGSEVSFTTSADVSASTHSCGANNIHNPNLTYGGMNDQDGYVYKTIVIGNQEWMAENLNTSHYRNGDLIPVVSQQTSWVGLNTGASSWYENDSAAYHCPFGKLYNWYAVSDMRNICPSSWHIPTKAEWSSLEEYLGGDSIAGGKMKSTIQSWSLNNIGASNSSGFSGILGASRYDNGSFNFIGSFGGFYWSSDKNDTTSAWLISLDIQSINSMQAVYALNYGFSVRCIKD